jgi:prophage regulatory protein
MKLLSKKQVREKVIYSIQHITRLEQAGKFPKRIRLGEGRVGWLESEIDDWISQKLLARDRSE